jgi:DNA-directed RNA polymerase subunit RPC12/RpoP
MLNTLSIGSPTASPVRTPFAKENAARLPIALLCVQCQSECELVQLKGAKPHTLVRCTACQHKLIFGGAPDRVREAFRQQLYRQRNGR